MMESEVVFKKNAPMGIPTREETINRQTALKSTLRHALNKIVKEIVAAEKATNGAATCILTTIASKGIAIKASPKPRAERANAAIKRIKRIGIINVTLFNNLNLEFDS